MKTIIVNLPDDLYETIKKDCIVFDCESGDVITAYAEIANRYINSINDSDPPEGELIFRGQLLTVMSRRKNKSDSETENR